MRRIPARSAFQRAVLCALALVLALAPVTGAAAATADIAATEEASATPEPTEAPVAEPTEAAEEEPELGADPSTEAPTEAEDDGEDPAVSDVESEDDGAVDEQDTGSATQQTPDAGTEAETDEAELEATADEVTTSEIEFGELDVYGDPDARRCNLIDFRYTDGHQDNFWYCGPQGDITQSMIPEMHVAELHISCSYVYDDGVIPKDSSHMIAEWRIVKYQDGEVWKDCGEIFVFTPNVEIEKWIDGDAETQTITAGEDATWTIQVTNTGNQTLTDVAVSDALASDCNRPNLAASLAAGADPITYTCTSADVTEGFINEAEVTTAENVSDTDTAAVEVLTPGISITKDPDQTVDYGGTATWTITVENTGDIPLTNVEVTDALAPNCDADIGGLAVGESQDYECSRDDVVASFTNVAVVDSDQVGPEEDDADVTVPDPALSADWECPSPGDGSVISGTTNRPLESVTLNFARDGGSQTITTTDTGDFSFAGTGDHDGKVIESADIESSDSTLDTTVTATEAQIDACYNDPGISIDKRPVGWDEADGEETQQVTSGEAASWQITVTNTGDVALTDVRVTDPLAADCELTGADAFDLAVGGSRTFTCDEPNVTSGFTNVATATGTPPLGDDLTDSDPSPVTVFTPALSADWECPTPGDGSMISGTTNVALKSVTLNFARDGGSQTITTTDTGDFSFAGTGDHAGKVIESADIESSVSSLDTTITPSQADMDACFVDAPLIRIDKRPVGWDEADGAETQEVTSGEAASWQITVTNTGDVALTDVRVTDPLAADCELTGADAFDLAVGGSRTFTCDEPNVTSGFTNVATATGTPPLGDDVSDSDPSPVTVFTPAAAVAITKDPDPQTVVSGGTATWTITVTNTGNVPLTGVNVSDELAPDCVRDIGDLAVGEDESWECSLDDVTVAFTNVAIVHTNEVPDEQDTAAVSLVPQTTEPSILLRKTASTPECPRPGDLITYRFELINNGNQTLTGVELDDSLLGGPVTLPTTTLAAGQVVNATATYPVTQGDIDERQVQNSATVTAEASSGTAVSNTSQAVSMLEPCADVLLEKDGPATATAGEQITYTFTVTNTGNVTLTNVRIFDERLDISGLLVSPSTLVPGQQGTATASYTVTEADADAAEILNTAFVRARTPDDTEIDDSDDHIVTVPLVPEAPEPAIQLVKDGPASAGVGETVTYTFTVTNTGEVTLTNVNITDPLLGLDSLRVRPSTLAPDEQGTATATYVITEADAEAGSVYNTAVARGRAPDGTPVRDRDDHTVDVPLTPPLVPPAPPELPATGLGTSGFALTALLSLALGGVLLGVAGSGHLQTAVAGHTVAADSPVLVMLRRWNLAPKPGGSQARRRRRR